MPTGKDVSRRKFSHSVAWPFDLFLPLPPNVHILLFLHPPPPPILLTFQHKPAFRIVVTFYWLFSNRLTLYTSIFSQKNTSHSPTSNILLQASFTTFWISLYLQESFYILSSLSSFEGPSHPTFISVTLISFLPSLPLRASRSYPLSRSLLLHILNQAPFSLTSFLEFLFAYRSPFLLHILCVSSKRSPQIPFSPDVHIL